MKKRICCLLLVFLFCLVLCVSAAATEQTGAQLSYVTDSAGLLSENENILLEKMAESVSKKYGVGVYIRIHAGLECGLFSERYPELDMVSFGPTLRNVHTPDEALLIPTVYQEKSIFYRILIR